jgi:hypothetical protein
MSSRDIVVGAFIVSPRKRIPVVTILPHHRRNSELDAFWISRQTSSVELVKQVIHKVLFGV